MPRGSGEDPVSFSVSGNSYILNTVGGQISTQSDRTHYVDVSMNPTDLNNFNGSASSSFNFTLSDYNITTQIKPDISNPYITVKVEGVDKPTSQDINIDESSTLLFTLNNAPSDISYAYIISGIQSSQIQGDISYGYISSKHSLQILMREDYKTQGSSDNVMFYIESLGLAVNMKLYDSTTNMLTSSSSYVKEGETFVIHLDIPMTDKYKEVLEFPYKITDVNSNVLPSNKTGIFIRSTLDISRIDISFQVNSTKSSQTFTIELTEPDNYSSCSVILNDIPSPILDVSGLYQVNEGQSIYLKITTPQSWEDNRTVPFSIDKTATGITKEDITLDTEYENQGSYNYNEMMGYFTIQDASALIRFKILPNRLYSEGTETLKFILSESDYRDVSASLVILDTVKPPSFSWSITDVSDNVITQVNEGGTFKFSLATSGVESGKDISYNITGITRDLISSENTLLSGVFTVDDTMSRTITIGKDFTTNGNKTFIVSTNLGDPLILDQYASIIINDTSQSPTITISSTVDRPQNNEYFSVIVSITNYNFLTDIQRGEQMRYFLSTGGTDGDTSVDLSVPAADGILILRNGVYSTITSSMNHTFLFLCKTKEQKTFTFLLGGEGGQSLTVRLNKQ